jgi:hypothetical protein
MFDLPPLLHRAQLTTSSIVIGSVFAVLPFYYFYHSDKPFNSEKKALGEARKGKSPGDETRDPRDSPIKTLADKKRRDG